MSGNRREKPCTCSGPCRGTSGLGFWWYCKETGRQGERFPRSLIEDYHLERPGGDAKRRLVFFCSEPDGRLVVRLDDESGEHGKLQVPPYCIDGIAEGLKRLGSEGSGDPFAINLETGEVMDL